MKSKIIYLMIGLILINIILVSAESSYNFKQNELVNYRFRCFSNITNSYCSDATQLMISVEYPNGQNALDNQSMTYNPTYFNVSLPTNMIGDYEAIIVSPTVNGTISEFTYSVTPSGFAGSNTLIFYFLILGISFGVIVLGFWVRDAWITIFGTFGLYFVGVYILINGIAGLKDTTTTYAIGIIILGVAMYISIRSALEVIND